MFRWNSADDDNFTQAGVFWSKVLNEAERTRLVKNIAGHMINAQQFIQKRAVRDVTYHIRHVLGCCLYTAFVVVCCVD